jgi:hypothetical protein
MTKLTREMKIVLNEEVTNETKRCLKILNKIKDIPGLELISKQLIQEIVKESPYIEFHPELLKEIPK